MMKATTLKHIQNVSKNKPWELVKTVLTTRRSRPPTAAAELFR